MANNSNADILFYYLTTLYRGIIAREYHYLGYDKTYNSNSKNSRYHNLTDGENSKYYNLTTGYVQHYDLDKIFHGHFWDDDEFGNVYSDDEGYSNDSFNDSNILNPSNATVLIGNQSNINTLFYLINRIVLGSSPANYINNYLRYKFNLYGKENVLLTYGRIPDKKNIKYCRNIINNKPKYFSQRLFNKIKQYYSYCNQISQIYYSHVIPNQKLLSLINHEIKKSLHIPDDASTDNHPIYVNNNSNNSDNDVKKLANRDNDVDNVIKHMVSNKYQLENENKQHINNTNKSRPIDISITAIAIIIIGIITIYAG